MLSCIAWIPKGAPAKVPQQYELPPEAFADLTESMKNASLDESATPATAPAEESKGDKKAEKKQKKAEKAASMANDDDEEEAAPADDDGVGSDLEDDGKEEDLMKALGMDDYDDDDEEGAAVDDADAADDDADEDAEEDDDDEEDGFATGGSIAQFLGSAAKDHVAPEDDEYMDEDEDDDEEDAEENAIRATDSCILVGNTSEEQSIVEVYVFDEKSSNLYVHHEIPIPSMPLALAWIPTHPRGGQPSSDGSVYPAKGSFAAVGTFLPGIEIWNCDVLNPVEPVCVLGGFVEQDPLLLGAAPPKGKGKKGKKGAKPTLKPGSHTDAVLALAFHPSAPARLASGSADTQVKLWDITTQQCTATLTGHKDKVQALEWNPTEFNVLLSGGYDHRVRVMDVRAPEGATAFPVTADIEAVRWNPHSLPHFFAATEDGMVVCRDIRNTTKPVWSLKAHKKAASCLAANAVVPNLFATASVDGTAKIWACDNDAGTPVCIGERNLNIGHVMSMSYDASSPFVLAAGGDTGTLAIWDTLENVGVNERYGAAAEKMGLGPQTLPADYVRMQKEGGQSKGIGPGREGTGRNARRNGNGGGDNDGDSDSEDGGDERMAMHRGGNDGENDDGDDE